MNDRIKKLLEEIEKTQRLIDPLSVLSKYHDISDPRLAAAGYLPKIEGAYAEFLRQEEMSSRYTASATGELFHYDAVTGLAHGVGDYLKSAAAYDALPHEFINATLDATTLAEKALGLDAVAYANMFRIPESSEVQKLAAAAISAAVGENLYFNIGAERLSGRMTAMHSPWVNELNVLDSANAFTAIQNIGWVANSNTPFGDKGSVLLREYLGDWRSETTVSVSSLLDTKFRSDYYIDLGFDHKLTAFTHEAFEEGLNIAGLRKVHALIPEKPVDEAIVDEYSRNAEASYAFKNFEIDIRVYLESKMTLAYGEAWVKHRVPGDISNRWKSRRAAAEQSGAPSQALIRYADFSDYIIIIGQNDNWDSIFKQVFNIKQNVQESFRRLTIVRNTVMHTRPVTHEDELYYLSEMTRVYKAIEVDGRYANDDE